MHDLHQKLTHDGRQPGTAMLLHSQVALCPLLIMQRVSLLLGNRLAQVGGESGICKTSDITVSRVPAGGRMTRVVMAQSRRQRGSSSPALFLWSCSACAPQFLSLASYNQTRDGKSKCGSSPAPHLWSCSACAPLIYCARPRAAVHSFFLKKPARQQLSSAIVMVLLHTCAFLSVSQTSEGCLFCHSVIAKKAARQQPSRAVFMVMLRIC